MDKQHHTQQRLRLALISDIHNEFLRGKTVPDLFLHDQQIDVLILAGDIDTQGYGAHWAIRQSNLLAVPVIYVLGNHEYYDASKYQSASEKIREITQDSHVHLLDCETEIINGCRFIGATLWSDFKLFGDKKQSSVIQQALWDMNDFKQIRLSTKIDFPKVMPTDMLRWFNQSVRYIDTELAKPFDGKTIVVTHHAPSGQCLPHGYEYDLLSAAYASNLDELIKHYSPDAWFYGHSHQQKTQRIGDTLVMNRPADYPGQQHGVLCEQGLKPMVVVL